MHGTGSEPRCVSDERRRRDFLALHLGRVLDRSLVVELADLMDAAWTLPPLDSLYGSVAAEAFRAAGLDVPRATVLSSVTPVRSALLASGRFLSMVSQGSVVRFGSGNAALKVLPINLPTTSRPVGIVTLKNRTLSPVAQLFIDCAHEVAKGITKRS